ncbi:MAG: hypothetical protein ACUVQK_15590, partial [Thermogutta sp.]
KNCEKMFPAGRWGHDFAGLFTPAAGNAFLVPTPNPENQGTSEHRNRLTKRAKNLTAIRCQNKIWAKRTTRVSKSGFPGIHGG